MLTGLDSSFTGYDLRHVVQLLPGTFPFYLDIDPCCIASWADSCFAIHQPTTGRSRAAIMFVSNYLKMHSFDALCLSIYFYFLDACLLTVCSSGGAQTNGLLCFVWRLTFFWLDLFYFLPHL